MNNINKVVYSDAHWKKSMMGVHMVSCQVFCSLLSLANVSALLMNATMLLSHAENRKLFPYIPIISYTINFFSPVYLPQTQETFQCKKCNIS